MRLLSDFRIQQSTTSAEYNRILISKISSLLISEKVKLLSRTSSGVNYIK
jgi:hypothetical protein